MEEALVPGAKYRVVYFDPANTFAGEQETTCTYMGFSYQLHVVNRQTTVLRHFNTPDGVIRLPDDGIIEVNEIVAGS